MSGEASLDWGFWAWSFVLFAVLLLALAQALVMLWRPSQRRPPAPPSTRPRWAPPRRPKGGSRANRS